MSQPQAPANGQGVIALACGHFRALPIADAQMAAELGGLIHCPECSSQAGGGRAMIRILHSTPMPVPDWDAFYRDRARAALAEYDARKKAAPAHRRGALFYPEMCGLLSEALRGWLDAGELTARLTEALSLAESEQDNA